MSNDVPQIPREHELVGPRTAKMLPIIHRAIGRRIAAMYQDGLASTALARQRFSEENP